MPREYVLVLLVLLSFAGGVSGRARKQQMDRARQSEAVAAASRGELQVMSEEAVAALSVDDVAAILGQVAPEISRAFRVANVDGQMLSACSIAGERSPKICGIWNALRAQDVSSVRRPGVAPQPPPQPPPPVLPASSPRQNCDAMGGTTIVVNGAEQCEFEPPSLRKAPAALSEVSSVASTAAIRRHVLGALSSSWEALAVKPDNRTNWEAAWLLRQGLSDHKFCSLLQHEPDCNYEALASAYVCYSESLLRTSLPHANSLSGLAGFQLLHDGADLSLATVQSVTNDLEAAVEREPDDWLTLMLLGLHHRYHILVHAGVFWPATDTVAAQDAQTEQIRAVADAQTVLLRAGNAMVADLREANLDRFADPHAQIWSRTLQTGQSAMIQSLLDIDAWLRESKGGSTELRQGQIYELAESMHVWSVDGQPATAKQIESLILLEKDERQRLVLATPA